MNVQVTSSAFAELVEGFEYIRQRNAAAALRFAERVRRALERLDLFPNAGERLPELPHKRVREVIAAPYRIIYRMEAGVVIVVSFWHQSRAEWPGADDAT